MITAFVFPRITAAIKQCVLVLPLMLLLSGCGQTQEFRYSQPPSSPESQPAAHFIAGVGQRDITPPPGIPRAGYAL